jgi:hypothetical protein
MPAATHQVFLGCASPDCATASEAHERPTAAGPRVWFDVARLNSGCDWHAEIEDAGCSSGVTRPILTPAWKQSLRTQFEKYGAPHIVPLLFGGNSPTWRPTEQATRRTLQRLDQRLLAVVSQPGSA